MSCFLQEKLNDAMKELAWELLSVIFVSEKYDKMFSFLLLFMCLLTHCLLVMSEVGIYDSDTYHLFCCFLLLFFFFVFFFLFFFFREAGRGGGGD